MKRLLFLHQGALGDFIVTFPVLGFLRNFFARIDGICRGEFGRLAKHLALVDGFYPQDAARFASLYAARIDPLVADLLRSYDHVLLFSFSEDLETSLRRIMADAVHRVPPWPREEEGIQVTDFLFHRLMESNWLPSKSPAPAKPPGCEPPGSSGNRSTSAPPSRIILFPGAGSRSKRWPLAGYLQVAAMVREIGHRPELLIGPAEEDLQTALSTAPDAGFPVHRPAGLVQLADLLQTADGFVGNDSAVSHLAAFLQVPTLVIFGPSNPDQWRPTGPRTTVLRAAKQSPGRAGRTKTGCNDSNCMKQIPAERVIKTLLNLIQR